MLNIGSTWHKWDLHVHTQSSYDYKYKAKNGDEALVEAWHENNISAAAITDHNIIDSQRIKHIREIANKKGYEITVFPGVELKTDTASPDVHVIGVFSESCDLEILAEDFRSFSREHGITPDSNSNYVQLSDISSFVKASHKGLISVHDGRKSNGLGQAPGLSGSKDDPNKDLKTVLRHDFRSAVDFLDTNSERSANELVKFTCVNDLKGLPVTVSSDTHSPSAYDDAPSVTWIKAELTFDGLKEAFSQPADRISFKLQPLSLENQQLRRHQIIEKVEVRSDGQKADWYGTKLQINLNPGLVTIIGNKGAGKSALSDVIGLDGDSRNMTDASFLSKKRFNNSARYGASFSSRLIWADGVEGRWTKLNSSPKADSDRVEYLPQRFIEKIASSVNDSELNSEIDKVMFGAVPVSKRLQQNSWQSLVAELSSTSDKQIEVLQDTLSDMNTEIINLEDRLKPSYITKKKTIS